LGTIAALSRGRFRGPGAVAVRRRMAAMLTAPGPVMI
jgi:hypothetical protein